MLDLRRDRRGGQETVRGGSWWVLSQEDESMSCQLCNNTPYVGRISINGNHRCVCDGCARTAIRTARQIGVQIDTHWVRPQDRVAAAAVIALAAG